MIKTSTPKPAPKKMLAISPQIIALSRSSSLSRMVVRDQLFVCCRQFRKLALVFQASQTIRQRSKSVADCVVLVSGGHCRHAVREFEKSTFKGHDILLKGQPWS